MNKKQAHYLATLAARETFKKTFEKLAQESQKPLTGGTVHVTDNRPGSYANGDQEMGHKQRNVSHKGDSLGFPMPSNSDAAKADDNDNDCDCDCDDCDCNDKNKEASASIMRIAAAYARTAR